MINSCANRLGDFIGEHLVFDRSRTKVLKYGLEILIGSFVKAIFFAIIAAALGIFPQAAAALFSSFFIRLAAGGVHCTSYWRCLLVSLVIYCTFGLTAKNFAFIYLPYNHIFILSSLLAAILALIYAPVDCAANPIINPQRRKTLKKVSVAIPLIYITAALITRLPDSILLAASLSILFQVFTLTPAGNSFIISTDNFLKGIIKV